MSLSLKTGSISDQVSCFAKCLYVRDFQLRICSKTELNPRISGPFTMSFCVTITIRLIMELGNRTMRENIKNLLNRIDHVQFVPLPLAR